MSKDAILAIEEINFAWDPNNILDTLHMRCVVGSENVYFIFPQDVINDYILDGNSNSDWKKGVREKIKNLIDSKEIFEIDLLQKLAKKRKDSNLEEGGRLEVKLEGSDFSNDYR